MGTAGSCQCSSDKRVHFGLGADKCVRLLEIAWPGGTVQMLEKVLADYVLTVKEPARKG